MNNPTDKINVLVVYEEHPERLLFFRTTMDKEEFLRAKKAHGAFIGVDTNEDAQWLYSQFFNEEGQQVVKSVGEGVPFSMDSCFVIHFGMVL